MDEGLRRIRIVLVGTTHPGNIGSAARAMKTMGLTDLVLVDPQRFPSAEATALAAGADDILSSARIVPGLDEAIRDCIWVTGTSARRRGHSVPPLAPEPVARDLFRRAGQGPVAIVFGRESSGLTNDELDLCNALVQIPTDPAFSSLNLAAAVQVMAYVCRAAALEHVERPPEYDPDPPATQHELEGLFEHYLRALVRIEFLDPEKPRHLMRRLRHLYLRAGLSASEVRILRGILTHTERGGGRPSNRP
ncbi:RNA methyltransferase [Thioalkalivibrio sp.]|uniref:RNA methyltransferase n=1 Tax=Thioalkalivibrio sp. TaxID=2093813 RepID=UPI003976CB81